MSSTVDDRTESTLFWIDRLCTDTIVAAYSIHVCKAHELVYTTVYHLCYSHKIFTHTMESSKKSANSFFRNFVSVGVIYFNQQVSDTIQQNATILILYILQYLLHIVHILLLIILHYCTYTIHASFAYLKSIQ